MTQCESFEGLLLSTMFRAFSLLGDAIDIYFDNRFVSRMHRIILHSSFPTGLSQYALYGMSIAAASGSTTEQVHARAGIAPQRNINIEESWQMSHQSQCVAVSACSDPPSMTRKCIFDWLLQTRAFA